MSSRWKVLCCVVLWWFSGHPRGNGTTSGLFLLLYGVFRFFVGQNVEIGAEYCGSTRMPEFVKDDLKQMVKS
ncbi:prolipoprotein diacylglyceryl transferase family protein [Marinobacter antarcticus]|uniref:prolipoprotein diacylglyceryl transferase family protein n=1 Tax=Marinobacter antarcticus TaxID=564117 RepID=UPI0032E49157